MLLPYCGKTLLRGFRRICHRRRHAIAPTLPVDSRSTSIAWQGPHPRNRQASNSRRCIPAKGPSTIADLRLIISPRDQPRSFDKHRAADKFSRQASEQSSRRIRHWIEPPVVPETRHPAQDDHTQQAAPRQSLSPMSSNLNAARTTDLPHPRRRTHVERRPAESVTPAPIDSPRRPVTPPSTSPAPSAATVSRRRCLATPWVNPCACSRRRTRQFQQSASHTSQKISYQRLNPSPISNPPI